MDEATSALDPRAERLVQDALNRVSADKTTLVIAHKLATVATADNIAVMTNGKVVEQGKHTELLERGGLYAAMVRAQDLGEQSAELEFPDEPEEDEKATLDRPLTLQRTQTTNESKDAEREIDHLAAGKVNYSLTKCVWILLKEHPDLYFWYLVTAFGGVIGGGKTRFQRVCED